MKKNLKKVAAMATVIVSVILSVCGLSSCAADETIRAKAQGGSTITIDRNYETTLVLSSSVNNNGIESVGTITGIGTITTDVDGETPLEYTLDANADAKVTLEKNIVTVPAENAGTVAMLESSAAAESDLTTNEMVKKSYNKTFTFSDGQSANAIYAYAYTNVQLTNLRQAPHVEITEVEYIDYEAMQIADNQYRIVLHFRASYKTYGVSTPTEGTLDLYPEYIQEVEATAPVYTYEEIVRYHYVEQSKTLQLEWKLTRNDGKKFSLWTTIAKFPTIYGHDELHVLSGNIVSSSERDLLTKEECIAAFKHAESNFFVETEREFTIDHSATGIEMHRSWMAESNYPIEGMGIIAFCQIGQVSFTDPETGYTVSKNFSSELKISEEKDVNLGKEGVTLQNGRIAPYIHSHQLTLGCTISGSEGYSYEYTTTATTNLYKVGNN